MSLDSLRKAGCDQKFSMSVFDHDEMIGSL
jgi:hypothetical protein